MADGEDGESDGDVEVDGHDNSNNGFNPAVPIRVEPDRKYTAEVVVLLSSLCSKRHEFNTGQLVCNFLEIKRCHYKVVDANRDMRDGVLPEVERKVLETLLEETRKQSTDGTSLVLPRIFVDGVDLGDGEQLQSLEDDGMLEDVLRQTCCVSCNMQGRDPTATECVCGETFRELLPTVQTGSQASRLHLTDEHGRQYDDKHEYTPEPPGKVSSSRSMTRSLTIRVDADKGAAVERVKTRRASLASSSASASPVSPSKSVGSLGAASVGSPGSPAAASADPSSPAAHRLEAVAEGGSSASSAPAFAAFAASTDTAADDEAVPPEELVEEQTARKAIFALIDADDDQHITRCEWESAFDKIDGNTDGVISRKEWYISQGTARLFDSIKRGQLAAVSRAEWSSAFDMFDLDSNGKISAAEWLQVASLATPAVAEAPPLETVPEEVSAAEATVAATAENN